MSHGFSDKAILGMCKGTSYTFVTSGQLKFLKEYWLTGELKRSRPYYKPLGQSYELLLHETIPDVLKEVAKVSISFILLYMAITPLL